jgi:hypothetical protein
MEAPFMKALVGGRQLRRLAVATVLSSELLGWPRRRRALAGARPTVVDGPGLAGCKLDAIACYPSQWPLFYPSLDGWRDALDEYGRRMGAGGMVERYWEVSGSGGLDGHRRRL